MDSLHLRSSHRRIIGWHWPPQPARVCRRRSRFHFVRRDHAFGSRGRHQLSSRAVAMPLAIEQIRSLRPQNEIHYFQKIGSTMTEAARLAALGVSHGTVVLSEEQTAGLGRLGRSWDSQPELGIYCSIVLRLDLSPANLPIASLLLGLATAEAIQNATQLACDLRWPNDVLIRYRKTAGILTHLVENAIVAGIGINVNHTALPPGLRTPAT